jgi:hypothetical protein
MRRRSQIRQFWPERQVEEGCGANTVVRERCGDYQDDFTEPLTI